MRGLPFGRQSFARANDDSEDALHITPRGEPGLVSDARYCYSLASFTIFRFSLLNFCFSPPCKISRLFSIRFSFIKRFSNIITRKFIVDHISPEHYFRYLLEYFIAHYLTIYIFSLLRILALLFTDEVLFTRYDGFLASNTTALMVSFSRYS